LSPVRVLPRAQAELERDLMTPTERGRALPTGKLNAGSGRLTPERFHIRALERARWPLPHAARPIDACPEILKKHRAYVGEHLDDMPALRHWTWNAP